MRPRSQATPTPTATTYLRPIPLPVWRRGILPDMAKRDYYEILGVPRSAGADEIKKAHRRLVRQYHPDANKNNPQSVERFKEVQEAYDVLSEAPKRAAYDQFGHAGVGAAGMPPHGRPGGPGGDPFEAFRRAQQGGGRARQWQAGPNVSVEDVDFSDVFEQFFGGRGGGAGAGVRGGRGGRSRPQPQPQRGADIEHPVQLTFEQAARGTNIGLQINRDGRVETIDVKIPPGVKEGSRVRIRGRGEQAGEPGDLYIVTRVSPHAYFRREDMDVYLEVPISAWEAMLGAKVEVPTLDGPVTLSIPPGTSGGAKLRIRGRGIERGGQKGDQFVIMRVTVPKHMSDADRATVEELAAKHPLNARADVGW